MSCSTRAPVERYGTSARGELDGDEDAAGLGLDFDAVRRRAREAHAHAAEVLARAARVHALHAQSAREAVRRRLRVRLHHWRRRERRELLLLMLLMLRAALRVQSAARAACAERPPVVEPLEVRRARGAQSQRGALGRRARRATAAVHDDGQRGGQRDGAGQSRPTGGAHQVHCTSQRDASLPFALRTRICTRKSRIFFSLSFSLSLNRSVCNEMSRCYSEINLIRLLSHEV